MTGYDHFTERRGQHDETGWDGDGQGTAELFGSLAWALARQSNLVRLACQRKLPASLPTWPCRAAARCCSLQLAPKRAGGFGAGLLASSAARLWIDSCEDGNR